MSGDEPDSPRRLVVFEPDSEGHPREWLLHLIRHLEGEHRSHIVWLVVARELYPDLVAAVRESSNARVRVLALGPFERRLCLHRSLTVSAFARWWTMRRYLRRTGAEAGHFLTLDLLTLPLALGLGGTRYRLSGILFRPSVHYRAIGHYVPEHRERLRDLRKALLYPRMLRNRALRVALTLDPYFPGYAARLYRSGHKAKWVPDPAHPPVNATPAESRLADMVPSDRVLFVLFGYLTERKGVLALLDAMPLVRREIAATIAVVIAGRVDPAIREAVGVRISRLAARRSAMWFHLEDRRLATGEIDSLVRRCDAVLAPYQRFVGSSGVLLWAARHGKPLLTQDYGLIGRMVDNHALGLAVNTSEFTCLAEGIERMAEHGPDRFVDRRAAQEFVMSRTPGVFASAVLESLLTE